MAANGNNKVLVTGASGMIGRQVASALQAVGYGVVRAQVRDRLKARELVGDVFDFALAEIFPSDFTMMVEQDHREMTKGCHTVVHAAGLVHHPDAPYQEYEVINVRATQALVEAAAANRVHTLIFFSSSAVYGPGPFSNVQENTPPKAKTPYAVSKLASEKFLQSFQGIPRVIILRPSMVFGEGDQGNLIKMIREIKNQRYKHIGQGDTGKSVIYTKDVARAVLLALNKLPEGQHLFNVSNPEPISVHDLAEEIASCLQLQKKIPSVHEGLLKFGVKAAEMFAKGKSPLTSEQVEKLTTETTCSVARFIHATGFAPKTSLPNAIKAEIDWASRNNLL